MQQVLVLALHPHRAPDYVQHDEGDAAHVNEVERLAKIVARVLAEK